VLVAPRAADKQYRQKDSYKPLSLENMPVARGIPLVTPETEGPSGVPDENNTKTGDVGGQGLKEILHESRRIEPEKREKPIIAVGRGTGEGTGYTYRAVDLFDDKLPQVARRAAQSPPSVGNIPRKVVLSPEPVQRRVDRPLPQQPVHRHIDRTLPWQSVRHRIDETLHQKPIEHRGDGNLPQQSVQRHVDERPPQEATLHPVDETLSQEPVQYHADETQMEMNDDYRPEKNMATEPLYEAGAGSYRPVHKLPLTSQVISAMETGIARKAISYGHISRAMPDFPGPSSHTLDLPLAPVTRIEVMRQQEEYLRTGQIEEELTTLRLAQKTQSTQTPPIGTQHTSKVDSNEDSTENNDEKSADYRTLAHKIYPFIRRMVMIERERLLPR